MKLPSIRVTDFLAFLLCTALLITGIYLEQILKLEPCPLCILQRIIFMVLGVLFLLGSLLKLKRAGQKYYHFFIALVGVLGLLIAGRHVWIQHLPANQVPSCGGNLKYLLQILPLNQAILVIFQGTGSCAKVTWRLLGMSIPMWTLGAYAFLTGLSIWQALRPNSTHKLA